MMEKNKSEKRESELREAVLRFESSKEMISMRGKNTPAKGVISMEELEYA